MERTTLAYLRRNGSYLMLHRTGKIGDINSGKWLGVGGHFEQGETAEMCIRREILEETGFTPGRLVFCGQVFFDSDSYPPEIMYLYVCDDFSGDMIQCDEGELAWIPENMLGQLPMWEGDSVFLNLIKQGQTNFYLHLIYEGSRLKTYRIRDLN